MPRPPLRLGRLSMLLLILLREARISSAQIAYYLGLDRRVVSVYLSRLKAKGLVAHDELGWYLTDKGLEYIEGYISAISNIHNKLTNNFKFKQLIEYFNWQHLFNRNLTEIQHLFNRNNTNQLIHRIEKVMGRPLTPEERSIIEYLADFMQKTGRKYWWPGEPLPLHIALRDELERLGISISSNSIERALRVLESRGVIFITYDTRRGVAKLRISRSLLG